MQILVVVTPNFNLAATMAFIDPFRAANYLDGTLHFHWTIGATASTCLASNGIAIDTALLSVVSRRTFDLVAVSSSWAPETASTSRLLAALRNWGRQGSIMAGIDTGAFILADAGLLNGRKATVHYEHIDAMKELHPKITVTEDIFVQDANRLTCCGGLAAADMALHVISAHLGPAPANAAARYIFHPRIRATGTPQNPPDVEPLGNSVPEAVRHAIALMELHLENILSVPQLCARLKISQRQLDRLFRRYAGKSPVLYYRDIRLDRARGLVTQTDMRVAEVALASGFASPVHFSRAYRERFGLSPQQDRIEGRIPFEFRSWPLHRAAGKESRQRTAKKV